jgi:hypothetical protein
MRTYRAVFTRLLCVAALVGGVALSSSGTGAQAAVGLEGVPRLKHVFVIVLENEDFDASWGPKSPATYLNSLVPHGAFADRYYAASHLSADNYIAMTTGQVPALPFQSDCQNWAVCYASEKVRADGGRSIADQLEEHGLSWGAYMGSMSKPCLHPAMTDPVDPYSKGYATRHNPFVYYPPIVDNQARCEAHVRPYNDLPPQLAAGSAAVPNYVFITPDTCDDGHDAPCADGRPGGLVSADAWLRANVPLILRSPAYRDRGALFITFDEASNQDISGCCATGVSGIGLDGGGRIGLLMLSPMSRAGHATDTYYSHNSLLRTVEDAFGIGEHLNQAGASKEKAMADLFGRWR